jgi:hypothetical protein
VYVIGSSTFGEVECLDEDAVITEFYCAILPLWPKRSFYLHAHGGERVASEIPLHRTSVALGYLRITTWLAAWMVTLGVVLSWDRHGGLWPLAIALTAAATTLQFAAGRLDADERDRRRLLRRVVGLGAPPELLPRAHVDATRVELERRWHDAHDSSWFESVARGDVSELLAALADYSGRPDLARDVRDRLAEELYN